MSLRLAINPWGQYPLTFKVHKPNDVGVSEATFILTRLGWLYLTVVINPFSRMVIGWAMRHHNDRQLVKGALITASWRRKKAKHVIVHSGQGSTDGTNGYQKLLSVSGYECRMNRKEECLDNAVAESFFGTLKINRCPIRMTERATKPTKACLKKSRFSTIGGDAKRTSATWPPRTLRGKMPLD